MAIGVAQIADIGANSRQPILDNNVFCPIHRVKFTHLQLKNKIPTRGTEKKEVATSMLLQH